MLKNVLSNLKTLVTGSKTLSTPSSPSPLRGEGGGEVSSCASLPSVNELSRRSTSKIARLPAAIRDTVNSMIHDGIPYDDITAKLTELGHPGFTHQNVSRWKQ